MWPHCLFSSLAKFRVHSCSLTKDRMMHLVQME